LACLRARVDGIVLEPDQQPYRIFSLHPEPDLNSYNWRRAEISKKMLSPFPLEYIFLVGSSVCFPPPPGGILARALMSLIKLWIPLITVIKDQGDYHEHNATSQASAKFWAVLRSRNLRRIKIFTRSRSERTCSCCERIGQVLNLCTKCTW
jgi:hypothetical protein